MIKPDTRVATRCTRVVRIVCLGVLSSADFCFLVVWLYCRDLVHSHPYGLFFRDCSSVYVVHTGTWWAEVVRDVNGRVWEVSETSEKLYHHSTGQVCPAPQPNHWPGKYIRVDWIYVQVDITCTMKSVAITTVDNFLRKTCQYFKISWFNFPRISNASCAFFSCEQRSTKMNLCVIVCFTVFRMNDIKCWPQMYSSTRYVHVGFILLCGRSVYWRIVKVAICGNL